MDAATPAALPLGVQRPHPIAGRLPRWLGVLLALAIALAANSLYANRASALWPHPDQVIPVKVLQGMQQRGDLDTDWAKADLREEFRACRYNFSGYLVFAHAAITAIAPASIGDDAALVVELQSLSRVLSALTLALVFLLLAHHLGWLYGIGGAVAVLLVPQLYQDAHYARPEALSTFCFTAAFALATLRPSTRTWRLARVLAIAVIAGFLASIKFTQAAAILLAVPGAYACWRDVRGQGPGLGAACGLGLLLGGGMLLGFAVGAPAALSDPAGFLQGIQALRAQYGGGHPPFGHLEGGVLAQGRLITGYYLATLGVPMLGLHVAGYAGRTLAPAKQAFAAIALVCLGGFLLQKVFFERNFSLLLPAFVAIAMVGLANVVGWLRARLHGVARSQAVVVALGVALFVASQVQAYSITHELTHFFAQEKLEKWRAKRLAREQAVQAAVGAQAIARVGYGQVFSVHWPRAQGCQLFIADTYGDDWSARYLRALPDRYRVVDTIASDFASVPTSTLHTYHSGWRVLFVDPAACAGRPL